MESSRQHQVDDIYFIGKYILISLLEHVPHGEHAYEKVREHPEIYDNFLTLYREQPPLTSHRAYMFELAWAKMLLESQQFGSL